MICGNLIPFHDAISGCINVDSCNGQSIWFDVGVMRRERIHSCRHRSNNISFPFKGTRVTSIGTGQLLNGSSAAPRNHHGASEKCLQRTKHPIHRNLLVCLSAASASRPICRGSFVVSRSTPIIKKVFELRVAVLYGRKCVKKNLSQQRMCIFRLSTRIKATMNQRTNNCSYFLARSSRPTTKPSHDVSDSEKTDQEPSIAQI